MGKADGSGAKGKGAIVTDARFAAVHTDPRFQRFPKAKQKVEIDERFAGMFNDPSFQVRSSVDKRGRKVGKAKKNEDMRKFYRLRDEDDWKRDAEDRPSDGVERQAADHRVEAVPVGKKHAKALQPARDNKAKAAKLKQPKAQASALVHARPLDGASEDAQTSSDEDEQPQAAEQVLRGPEAANGGAVPAAREPGSDEEDGDESEDDEEDEAAKRWARLRGFGRPEESSSEDEDVEDDWSGDDDMGPETSTGTEQLQEWGVGALAANPDEKIPTTDETRRLAIVDLDWERIRAVDILAVLRSFLGKHHAIECVTVYPSDYGLERMKQEAVLGPQGIYSKKKRDAAKKAKRAKQAPAQESGSDQEEDDSDAADSDSGADEDDGASEEAPPGKAAEADSDSGDEVNQKKLQLYERSKLRYYYAVVECNTVAAAAHLYSECDGMEFERSACKLDLRFVPEEQSFEGRAVRDTAAQLPDGYEAPVFMTAALQHTNVKLTWDAEDETRKKALTRRLTEDQIREEDFKAYLGSEDDADEEEAEGEETGEALRERYRKLLLEGGGGGETKGVHDRTVSKAWGRAGEEDGDSAEASSSGSEGEAGGAARVASKERGMEMEVTFTPGLEGLGERLAAKQRDKAERKGETVWEAYLRRRREKKKAALAMGRHNVHSSDEDDDSDGVDSGEEAAAAPGDDAFFQHENDPFADPFFQDKEGGPAAGAEPGPGKAKTGKAKAGTGVDADRKQQRAERRAAAEVEKRKQAELELLMLDEAALNGAGKPGVSSVARAAAVAAPPAALSRKERLKQKKAKRKAERQQSSDDEDLGAADHAFEVNLEDPRFQSLFSSHHFALDPTHPDFKRSEGAAAVLAASAQRRQQQDGNKRANNGVPATSQADKPAAAGGGKSREALQLNAMVMALKRKTAPSPGQQTSSKPSKAKKRKV
ncbi:hypothetical protein WJX72_002532 [[Myrmecia] bisecta]|uniref:NUC153 domain-containing protein n=1 Tax=[Myrmecia] bisecta TaxID=41462 RepID=A0AAW1R5L2_9CHLO